MSQYIFPSKIYEKIQIPIEIYHSQFPILESYKKRPWQYPLPSGQLRIQQIDDPVHKIRPNLPTNRIQNKVTDLF